MALKVRALAGVLRVMADVPGKALAAVRKRLTGTGKVDLHSRHGIDDALWKILVLSLIAALAAGVLFVLGPKLLSLGAQAVQKVQAPPW
jgi:hypothetical protein